MFKKYGWVIAPLLIAALLCSIPFGHDHLRADGIGASASCNLDAIEGTIVCDSTTQQATMLVTVQKGGYLVNGGANAVFINFSGAAIAQGFEPLNLCTTYSIISGANTTC